MNSHALPKRLLLARRVSRTETQVSCRGLLEVKTAIPVENGQHSQAIVSQWVPIALLMEVMTL